MKKNNVFHLLVNPNFIVFFLLLIFILVAIYPYIGYDEALWTYIGRLWNSNGIPPYVGAVENKTPGIYMLYAIADVFGTYNIVFVRGIGVLVSISTAITLYSICTRIYNEIAGAICMYVFGLVICWNDLDGFSFSQTETFMIFFSTLSFYFMIRAKNNTKNVLWLLFSGLSIGIAIVFKQIAITTTVGLILAFLVFNSNGLLIHKLKGIVVISFGVCISTLLSYLVLYFYGVTFYEYIEGAWLILLNSGSKISEVKEHLENFMNVFVFSRFVLFYPFLLLFFIQRRVLNKEFFIVLLIWLVFDFIGVNASGYYYGHQVKQLLPSLSIMAGIGICYGINKTYRRDIIDKKSKVVTIIILLSILAFPYKQIYRNINSLSEFNNQSSITYLEIGDWIKKNTNKDDYIYILGAEMELVQIMAISQRLSSSKYFHSIFITTDIQREEILEDLKKKPPRYILKHKNFDKELITIYGDRFNSLIQNNYVVVKETHDVEIFKRN